MEETLSGEVNTPLHTISNFIWNPKIHYFGLLSCYWSISWSIINLCPHIVTHWVKPSKNIGLVLEHQILHLWGKNQAFVRKVLGTRLGHMPSSYINKLSIQGLNETFKMRSVIANTSLSNNSLVLPTMLFRIAIDWSIQKQTCQPFRCNAMI